MEPNKPLVSEKTSFSAIKRLWFLMFVLRSYLILPVVSREVFGAQSLSFFTLPVVTAAAAAAAKSRQSCPTLCDPRDGSPPGSPVPGILQARTLNCANQKIHQVMSRV